MAGRALRLDAIVRVSQSNGREGESFRSPEQQTSICERTAVSLDATIVARHVAVDVSGKTMDRRDIDAALKRIRAGHTDGIVVAWLDRFSRAPVAEALRVYDDINRAGGRVIAADMAGIDARDPTGELALTVMLGVNRMNWRRAAERWDMCRADAVRAGIPVARAPYGYTYRDPTPRDRGGVVDRRLVPDEPRAGHVREVFRRKAMGATWLELARYLDDVDPKPTGRKWGRNTVRGIIDNRTYLGEVRHGEHVNPYAHEPIVDRALWRRAQVPPGRRTPRGTYLLTGLIRCAGCGRRMNGNSQGAKGYRIYLCPTRDCSARSTVGVNRLDEYVVGQFLDRLEMYALQRVDDADLEQVRAGVEDARGTVERLAAVVPTHPSAIAAHQQALTAAERTLIDAEDRLDQLIAARGADGPDVRQLRDDWPRMTLEERRVVLRAGIDAVLVRRASRRDPHVPIAPRVLVLYRGEAPEDLIRRLDTRATPIRRWTWDDDPGSLTTAA